MNSKQIAEQVKIQVIEGLEEGYIPWHKPWQSSSGLQNFATGHKYSGVNTLLLNLVCAQRKYTHPLFASFKQVNNLGGKINKGERGVCIVFSKRIEIEDKDNPDQKKQISLLKNWTVFNLEQTNLDFENRRIAKYIKTEPKTFNIISKAEEIVDNSHASILTGGDIASYNKTTDIIKLPDRKSFDTGEDYYNTAFHELIHWTGHPSRLDRLIPTGFGSDEYSQEELVAEIGANMIAFVIGMSCKIPKNSQAYIRHWLSVIKNNDAKFIIHSSSKAEKAMRYLTTY